MDKWNWLRLYRSKTNSYITVYHPNCTIYAADEFVNKLFPGWDLIQVFQICPDAIFDSPHEEWPT